ncbi:transcription factor TFIIE beta subunit, TFIIEB, Tfa2 [Coemansia guatemalensis]|uniref:Transcription initiation factor IIE subunit beta n=1 Tax=Coemansia guatemalensis TaxID=2761395 RepID=A0A9W8I0W9_9FUNG|nr:transcription factor TFIIE beta subunit, TFIIEB, Tfa2 [Coemansia guatemalensis]
MSDLFAQQKEFRKRVATQPVVAQRRIVNPSTAMSYRRPTEEEPEAAKVHKDATLLTRVYQVIDFLIKSQRPCTANEIRMHIPDFYDDGPEFQHLANNEKVIYNSQDNTFAYKPEFDIRTPEDLVEYLKNIPDRGGLEVKKLNDSYLADKQSKVIADLRERKLILATTDKDNRPRCIFYNHWPLDDQVDEEMKTSWIRLVVPDESELAIEMKKADLKPTQIEKNEEENTEVKKPKKNQRKTKITNTHLVGIDLTKDYVPEEN